MQNYSQESGRGGRDGQRSEAIVVMPAGKQAALQKKQARAQARTQPWRIQSRIMSAQEEKQVEWDKIERFLAGEKCRRIFLDAEMDGRGYDDRSQRVRCEEGEEQCDVCETDDATAERIEAQRRAYVEEQEGQDQWTDSGIEVPSSSIPLPTINVSRDESHNGGSSSPTHGHSPSSLVSFDQGFATDVIHGRERDEFTAQQAQRSQQRWRTIVQERDEGQEVWDVENRLDSWVGKCPLCYVRQCGGWDVDVRHPFDQCPDELHEVVARDITSFEKVWFEKFASCTNCGVVQKICIRWRETYEGSRRFEPVPGGVCQYKKIIQPAIAAIMSAGPFEVVEVGLFQAMREEGIWGRGSKWGEWDEAEQAEVWQVMMTWFRKKIMWGSMEASVLLRVFYRLAVGLEEWRREQSIERESFK